jgi:hypothetical protein
MLTTVCVPQHDLGLFAAAELIRQLADADLPPRLVQFPLEIKIRNSCGAYRMTSDERRTLLRQLATSAGAGLPAQPIAAA